MKIVIELINWLRIAISPTLIGALIGGLIYLKMGEDGFLLSIFTTVIGGIIGMLWATKIWKKQGTTNFISRIDASPELDNKKNEL
ncbi:MAG: hypothetical protein V4561_05510 [Bacteroidota bacterium]